MPSPNFEQIEIGILNALEKAIAASPLINFKTIARRAEVFPNVGIDLQPALFLIPRGFQIRQDPVGAYIFLIHYKALIYSRAVESAAEPPQTFLNYTMQVIVNALSPDSAGGRVTLNLPQVSNILIEGDAPMEPAILDPQASMEIPIFVSAGM